MHITVGAEPCQHYWDRLLIGPGVDPFEAHAKINFQWLEAEADVGNQELPKRLIALEPERYWQQHKHTLQRRIRDWRVARVQQCLESASHADNFADKYR